MFKKDFEKEQKIHKKFKSLRAMYKPLCSLSSFSTEDVTLTQLDRSDTVNRT